MNRKRDFELCEAVYDGESSQVNVAPSHPVGVSVLGNDFRVRINNVCKQTALFCWVKSNVWSNSPACSFFQPDSITVNKT